MKTNGEVTARNPVALYTLLQAFAGFLALGLVSTALVVASGWTPASDPSSPGSQFLAEPLSIRLFVAITFPALLAMLFASRRYQEELNFRNSWLARAIAWAANTGLAMGATASGAAFGASLVLATVARWVKSSQFPQGAIDACAVGCVTLVASVFLGAIGYRLFEPSAKKRALATAILALIVLLLLTGAAIFSPWLQLVKGLAFTALSALFVLRYAERWH